ncbi:MAG: nitrilase-related carbon-nitrogen hydrolase, partial [Anaerolineales bacterium]
MRSLTLGLAQLNSKLGDVRANLDKHLAYLDEAAKQGVELLVFPELSLCGYALQDLVPTVAHRPTADDAIFAPLLAASQARGIDVMVGFVHEDQRNRFFIAAAYL